MLFNINKEIYDELLNLNLEHLFNEFKSDNSKSFILDLYAPKDENNITESDRVFYTRKMLNLSTNTDNLLILCLIIKIIYLHLYFIKQV